MGIPVMIMGPSGSGKSSSMRNFKSNEVAIINVAGKPFPFRGKLPSVVTSDYANIKKVLLKGGRLSYVIDDSQYLMGFEEMDSTKSGYERFNSIGFNFIGLVRFIVNELPDDVIVYFLQHTEVGEDGKVKAKTLGKLIDNHYTLEGLFSIVLMCDVDKDKHQFITNSDGTNTCKSPMGMFEDKRMDNDLKVVDATIRDYWEIKKNDGEDGGAD